MNNKTYLDGIYFKFRCTPLPSAVVLAVVLAAQFLAVQSVAAQAPEKERSTTGPVEERLAVAAPADRPASKPVSPAEAKAAEALYQQGRTLFFQGKFAESAQKLAEAAAANPQKTSYQMLLAKAYRYAKKDEQATKVLDQLVRNNPQHVEAAIELAELISPKDQPDRVIAILEPLLKYKHTYSLYHLLAEAHYQKEQLENARGYYQKAIQLNPKNATDHYQLANIYLSQKRFAKAATSYEQAGALGISSGVFHFKLASVYFNLHNYLGKVTVAEVIGGKPGEIKNAYYLIGAAGKKDSFHVAGPKSAIYQAVKAQQLGVDLFEIKFLEANIWLFARRYQRAEKLYAKLSGNVQKADAGTFWYHWAQASLGTDDYDKYLSRLGKAIEAQPEVYKATLTDAYVAVANRYNARGKADLYIEYLTKAVQTSPLSARLHLALGDAHWLVSQNQQAVEQYRLVMELQPDHPERVRLLNRIRSLVGS